MAQATKVDVTDWNAQAKAFGQAVHAFGRIDYVYPIAGVGERKWMDNDPTKSGFEAPDLTVMDIDLKGLLYTISLAIQQFRGQDKDENGFRGKSIQPQTLYRKTHCLQPQSDVLRQFVAFIAALRYPSTPQRSMQ